MPLHVRRRKDTRALEIYGTVRPAGEKTGFRVRQRAGSDDEATAREEAILLEREILRRHHLGERPQARTFAEAYKSYLTHEARSTRTIKTAFRLLRHFGEMPLDQITQETVDITRGVILSDGAAPATVLRNLVVPLRAIMVHAAKRGWGPSPVFDAPAVDRRRPEFLLPVQVDAVIAVAAEHIKPLLRFLACTGCRLSEALSLEWRDVDLAGARAILWEGETKGGSRRVIDLVPAAVDALRGVGHQTGRVFLTPRRHPYRSSEEGGGQLKRAWGSACGNAGLPGEWRAVRRPDRRSVARVFAPAAGIHILRHTWATWWYDLTPDPLRLMAAGGWSSVRLVERYAKIMPAGHQDAIRAFWGMAVNARYRAQHE